MFGIIDMIVLRPGMGVTGVQIYGADHSPHMKALLEPGEKRDAAIAWIQSGGILIFHGWRKLKQRNADGKIGKSEKFELRETVITLDVLGYFDIPECLK
jgi:hypothetical protein